MFGKFIKEEKGMTMALTIFMIVIIGVMGAGLLTFVQKDLESVVEVNKGQNAFEMADAGVQVARQQIRRDADPEHYDLDGPSGPLPAFEYLTECNDPGDDSTTSARAPVGEDWSPAAGVTRNVPGSGKFTVTIRWLSRAPAANAACRAPVAEGLNPTKSRFFRVVSTGEFNGAKRKVEAVLSTVDQGVPRAYFTPDDITVNGSACVKNVSLFTLGKAKFAGGGGCVLPGGGKTHMQGVDFAYGDWKTDEFNKTARSTTDAGIGAVGEITGKVAGRDYDSVTSPKFVQTPSTPQPPSEISFPFNYSFAVPGTAADQERLAFYEAEAKLQGNYLEISGTGNENISSWLDSSSYNTVVYRKFTGANPGALKWDVPGDCSAASSKKGILIVENGNYTTQPNRALFSGMIIVRGGIVQDGTYADSGNTCTEGFANASGDITISGSANPSTTPDLANSPGFYGVRVWSWRECDEAAAGSC